MAAEGVRQGRVNGRLDDTKSGTRVVWHASKKKQSSRRTAKVPPHSATCNGFLLETLGTAAMEYGLTMS